MFPVEKAGGKDSDLVQGLDLMIDVRNKNMLVHLKRHREAEGEKQKQKQIKFKKQAQINFSKPKIEQKEETEPI